MNYITLIIVAVVGIALGAYFARGGNEQKSALIAEQGKKKKENKQKILDFLRENEKIQNDDVEKLVKVSNATAERYLNELEKEGKINQHGKVGQNVFYTLK